MANILFAWELGGNLGHFTILLPIAHELRRLGHHVTFALRELSVLAHDGADFDFAVLQSPRWMPMPTGIGDAVAYSDVLPSAGYFSAKGLKVLIAAWQQLFELVQADLVVCQHAPTALLAARIDDRRVLCIGTGFVCPTGQSQLPRFGILNRSQELQLQRREKFMLDVCNAVLGSHKQKHFQNLADLFSGVPTLLCTHSEFDHYGERGAPAHYVGPIYSDVTTSSAPWPQRYEHNILVYLNNHSYWERQIAALQTVRANILIIALELPSHWLAAPQPDHITVVDAPIALQPVLARADLVICHGGHGTVAGALAAGKPLLIWPSQKEQGLMAQRLKEQQLGAYCEVHRASVEVIAAQVEKLLVQPATRTAAQAFARKYSGSSVEATVRHTAAHIDRMVSLG